jgi:hypothetical protein
VKAGWYARQASGLDTAMAQGVSRHPAELERLLTELSPRDVAVVILWRFQLRQHATHGPQKEYRPRFFALHGSVTRESRRELAGRR